jgi:endoglycosylceramidase
LRRGLLAFALALALAPSACAAPALPLGHSGRWITDAHGRVVGLHGLNMVDKRAPYAPDATGFGDDDAEFLAAEGFNVVRVGLIYKAVEPQPGIYDDAYLDRIRTTVDELAAHGIVSMLDFHQDLYNERFQGEGWPDWAVIDDGLPAQPASGFPANYLVMPALQRAFDHFLANDAGLQDRYAAAWAHVAERFRDVPSVLGYELLNEPWPGTAWQDCANPAGCPVNDARLEAFDRRVLGAIRAVDPRGMVWHEPFVLFNFGGGTTVRALGDPDVGFAFHDYCLSAEKPGAEAACAKGYDLVFQHALEHVSRTKEALLLTEFGATDASSVLGPMLRRADDSMVSWTEWHYCGCDDPTTSGPGDKQAIVLDPAKPPAGDNLKKATLDQLARPYPQLVAGTPQSWSYTDGVFRARWTTERPDGGVAKGDTEIVLPARAYPGGYAAGVQGGRIVSAKGDRLLRVAACAGSPEVAVTVGRTGAPHSSCKPPPLLVTIAPRRVRSGSRVRLTVTVRPAMKGARVRIGGRRARTGRSGRARVRARFAHPGTLRVSVRSGARAGHTTLAVLRRVA